jgi:hypothetical protein
VGMTILIENRINQNPKTEVINNLPTITQNTSITAAFTKWRDSLKAKGAFSTLQLKYKVREMRDIIKSNWTTK